MKLRKYLSLSLVLLAFVPSLVLRAGESEGFLAKGVVQVAALLPDPAAGGSPEALAELALVRQQVAARTPADEALMLSEEKVTMFTYASVLGQSLVPGRYPKLEALMIQMEKSGGAVIRDAKQRWSRPRPFVVDSSIKASSVEKSFSYPSGHGTRGMLYALVLAEVFPAQREALLVHGRAVGWHRVQAGVHYPSDIQAGRVLGLAIFSELMRSDSFVKALAEAKAEVSAVTPAK